jgi:hypothetical protein
LCPTVSDDSGLRPASPPHTVGCKSFPDFAEPLGEIPVNRYNRPYHRSCLPVRQVARRATHASPFQSARNFFVESAIERTTSRLPVKQSCPWRTERARGAGVQFSRLSGPYSSECGAVRLSEREYPAQRPPAARGLSTHNGECGAVTRSLLFQTTIDRNRW